MKLEKHCYIFDYNRGEIWHIDVRDCVNVPLDEYGDIDWESILAEQDFNLDEVEYMVTGRELYIKEWFD